MGKGQIARNEQFLLFPQCFLPIWQTFCHFHQVWNCRLQALSVWKSLKFVVWERVKSFLNKPWFLRVCSKSFENTVGKGQIAGNEQFLLFPQCFLPIWQTFCHFHQVWNCCLQALSVWKSPKFVVWERVNPFHNKPWFLRVCSKSLLKTLWEKEKLLVTSNFSFSRSVFYPFGKLSAIFIKFEIVVCKLFQFGRVQNLFFGKGLKYFSYTMEVSA